MANFFSSIQGKFKAEYQGRYLGNIIEHIAEVRPEVVDPLIELFDWPDHKSKKEDTPSVSSEYVYDQASKEDENRRADLCIKWGTDSVATLLVEIKILDDFLPRQLNAYAGCAEADAVVILTARPLDPESKKLIEKSNRLKHCYLSQYAEEIASLATHQDSELLTWFYQYLQEEGYVMYNLMKDEKDYPALLSFMVLNFLPHESGKRRVVSKNKIARGPGVFNDLVINWQQMSFRLAKEQFQKSTPTIRYFPEQGYRTNEITRKFSDELFDYGDKATFKKVRDNKIWGKYHFTALVTKNGLSLEWGQVISIQDGNSEEEEDIGCIVYAAFIYKQKIISGREVPIADGIQNPDLYAPEKFKGLLMQRIRDAAKEVKKDHPELKELLASYAL